MEIARQWLMLLVFVLLPAVVKASHKDICGSLNSIITLLSSSDPVYTKEVRWTRASTQVEMLIAKTSDGNVTNNEKYNLLNNGRKLEIKNLTEEDTGIYTVEITLTDGELKTETFNITICGDRYDEAENEHLSPSVQNTRNIYRWIVKIVFIIMVLVGFVVMLRACWKRSSDSSGQGDQNNEVVVNFPIQDTRSQDSLFIEIPHGK